jgi:RNA-directed DNA polymerase
LLTAPKGAFCQIVGGAFSPLLANVYLHYVLDVWFEQQVKPCLKGRAFLVRYADDFVMGNASEEDARRVLAVLPKRLGKYGLTIHPDKTRLVPFVRPGTSAGSGAGLGVPSPGSFDFLGFRHSWSRSKQGRWVVKRQTAGSRFRRAVGKIAAWCRLNRHWPIGEQYQVLSQKPRGHTTYYGGVIGNVRSQSRFRYVLQLLGPKWLGRRRRRGQLTWAWFNGPRKHLRLPWPAHWAPPRAANP